MRHRIKAGKVGSFTPVNQKVEVEQLENREIADEVEKIFEEDSVTLGTVAVTHLNIGQ